MRCARVCSVTRSTAVSTCSAGRFAARTRRSASARTCQICQVERVACRVSRTRSPVAADPRRIHLARAGAARRGEGRGDHRGDRSRPAEDLARLAVRHAVRCSVRVRGSCLASRVSRVACWARWMASTSVGGRPCSAWNAAASSPRRSSMLARRVDQRWFSRGSTPTTSRIGRLVAVGAGTLREDQPEPGSQVLLQGGVVGLGGGDVGLEQDPPVDREPLPGQGLHLVRDRDVGVQVRVSGA